MSYRLVMPSMGRAGNVKALALMPSRWCSQVILAVPESEEASYVRAAIDNGQRPGCIISVPDFVHGIAATRQWLTENVLADVLVQVSDDVKFFVRSFNGRVAFRKAEDHDLEQMFTRLVELAIAYGHSGVSRRATPPRDEWLRGEGLISYGDRACDVYAHDTLLLHEAGVRWDRVPVMEDMDVTLQLLRMGKANAVLYEWCWDQAASNAPGGCSSYRNFELQRSGAEGLQALHPDFVTVVRKKSKNWIGFEERYDVRVQWKKALASGLKGRA